MASCRSLRGFVVLPRKRTGRVAPPAALEAELLAAGLLDQLSPPADSAVSPSDAECDEELLRQALRHVERQRARRRLPEPVLAALLVLAAFLAGLLIGVLILMALGPLDLPIRW